MTPAANVAPDAPPATDLAELLAEVRRIEVQSRRLVADLVAGGYSSVFRGAGIEFEGVREYAEGDDPRRVDWNVTARVGRPFVKTYVEEREQTVLFLFDVSASTEGGWGPWSVRETGARVCACLALSASRNGDKAGLVAFGADVERWVPPKKGLGHALRIVRDCLALPAPPAPTRLEPALEFATRVVRRRAIVFVVSDFLADGWQRAMGLCARRHDVVAVRLLAPEAAPPTSGLVRLADPETGATHVVDWASPRVRRAWAERVGAWRARTEADLRRLRVDRMDVDVPRRPDRDAVARPLLAFFRMRERRGEKR